MISGSSPGPRYSALIGICSPGQFVDSVRVLFTKPCHVMVEYALREQNRRQPLASIGCGLVGAAPRFEELHQLLARDNLVALAIALDQFEQLVGRFSAVALGV